jgi:hypothetical protein
MSQVQTNFTAADMLGGANKAVPAKKIAPKPAPKVEAPVVVEEVAPVVEEVISVEEEATLVED